jgi:hypothetical protein
MNKTPEDEEFERIEAESGWRKRQIMAEDDYDIQDYKKPWVGLTDYEVNKFADMLENDYRFSVIKLVEQALKERNT